MKIIITLFALCLSGLAAPQAGTVSPADLSAAIDKLGSLDDSVRGGASQTVRRADAATAVPALVAAARTHTDGYVRYRALVLLAGFGTSAAADTMLAVIADKNDRLRAVSYAWFEHHPDPAVVPQLLSALETEQSEFVRPALIRALAGSASDARVQAVLLPLVTRGQDYFRAEVIQALGDFKAGYAGASILDVAKLEGPLQDEAILAIGHIGDPGALPALAELQRLVKRQQQASVSAAICLIGVNCDTHEAYLIETLKFAAGTGKDQALLRSSAHALAELAIRGRAKSLHALLDVAASPSDAVRSPVALAVGLVALRNEPLTLDVLEARPERDAAITVLRDAFDMLEEDFEEEMFFVAVRRAYWGAAEGSARRLLAAALIQKLEF